jgi:peptidoglycan/LPS O-acetylase OafA/YrhL
MFSHPMSPQVAPVHNRVPSLDGWRGVAVMLVLGGHMQYADGFPARYAWVSHVFDGNLGVRIFFVLSGFLITLLLLREGRLTGRISLRRFYVRRALRILPIYVAFLLVLALLGAAGLYADATSSWIGCLTFTRNVIGRGNSATVHLWSLAIEEQFYMLWPLLLAAFAPWRRPRVFVPLLLLVIVASPVLRGTLMSEAPGGSLLNRLFEAKSGLMYADSLVVGCLGAFLVVPVASAPAWLDTPVLSAIAFAAIAGASWLQQSPAPAWLVVLVPTVQAVAVMFLIWSTAFRAPGVLFRLLNLPPMVWVGTLSYSIYVWQMLFLSHFVPRFTGAWTHDWKRWVIGVFVVAAMSYYGLEKPMLKLKKRYSSPGALAV